MKTITSYFLSRAVKLLILIYIFFFISNSCSEEFLNQSPNGEISEDYITTEQGIEELLIGAYSLLDGFSSDLGYFYAAGSNWLWGDVYSDEAYHGSDAGDQSGLPAIENYELDWAAKVLWYTEYTTKWNVVYNAIWRSNCVLKFVKMGQERKTIDAELALQIEAEARFLRAYYHIEAIKMWDFIPFVDETKSFGEEVPNYPPSEVGSGDAQWGGIHDGIPWNKVEEDLQFAIDHLPNLQRNGQPGRACRYTALGIMARVKLFQGNYEDALPLLNEIIQCGRYSLSPSFHENFKTSGNNNSESIFDIQASVNDGTLMGENGNFGDILNYPYGGGPGRCCGFYQPTQNLVNAFKTQNGLPYLKAFGLDFNSIDDDVKNDVGIISSDPFITDSRPLDPRLDYTVGRRGIPYLDWGLHPGEVWIREQDYGGPYSPIKNVYYKSEEGINTQASGWVSGANSNNYSVLRFADVILMAAECEVETGSLDNARNYVNQVRNRAANSNYWVRNIDNPGFAANYDINPYPVGGPMDPFQSRENALEAVRFERRLELGMEGHRFWDLKRWGIAKSTLNAYLAKERLLRPRLLRIESEFKDRNIRHPIPYSAINNSHKIIKQNPGY